MPRPFGVNPAQKNPRPTLSEEERRILSRLRNDFEHYASRCLVIRGKDSSQPFRLNRAQQYLHRRIEEQRVKTGRVRALILKGRQQGCSTYVEGRFYWRVSGEQGKRAFILTHEDEATKNLFEMAQRFHENVPEIVRPSTKASNAKELYFNILDSGYRVGTARTKGAGRSGTVQYFHGCLSPDTFIITETGDLRCMGDFAIGDLVRTHTGQMARVSAISRQIKPAYRITLKGMGQIPLTATAEHRFLTENGWRKLSDIDVGEKLLFPVDEIVSSHGGWPFRLPDAPRPQGGGRRETGPDNVFPTYELGRVLGLYLAEGCVKKQSKGSGEPAAITFSVHEREVARTEAWLDAVGDLFLSRGASSCKKSKTVAVTVYGRSFATFVHSLCGELDEKHLPFEWNRCGKDFVRGLIHGYLAGDGCSSKREYDRRISAPSIRSAISVGMRDALASLGYGWSCLAYHPGRLRYGKKCRPIWTLRLSGVGVDRLCEELGWSMPPRRRNGNYGEVQVVDGYARIPILDIEDVGEIDVMDFEVDHEDHSYCTVQTATHNSEIAHWPNQAEHMAGVMQSIPSGEAGKGTEVILETTANGIGELFYRMWRSAERGISEYQAIFIPWYWQDEYKSPLPEDFEPDDEERQLLAAYAGDGLTSEHLQWRRLKIATEFEGETWLFRQEYPFTASEAFQTSTGKPIIQPRWVLAGRQNTVEYAYGPRILGVDVARQGKDRSAMALRQGRKVHFVEAKHDPDLMSVAGWVMIAIKRFKPHAVFIDETGGYGAAVVDRLRELGQIVIGVQFGGKVDDPDRYRIKRDEIWGEMAAWFAEGGIDVPDDDDLQADLCGPEHTHDSKHRLILESKEKMEDRGLPSPDKGDALALTFSHPVMTDEAMSAGGFAAEPEPVEDY